MGSPPNTLEFLEFCVLHGMNTIQPGAPLRAGLEGMSALAARLSTVKWAERAAAQLLVAVAVEFAD
eukprot:3143340-Pleurochrysis_carterae.AAC.1